MKTEGVDANGHYWNNICSMGGIYIYPGTSFSIVDANNSQTGYDLFVNVRFTTNGKSGGGGLLSPSADLLGDLAVASATEDYCFLESAASINQHHAFMTFRGLDPQKAYRFHSFGSRNTAEERAGWWEYRGENVWEGYQQIAGSAIGANGYNGNNNQILVSDPIFPDANGEIRMTMKKFRTDRMLMLNALKVEELSGLERPNQQLKLKQKLYLDVGENNNSRGHKTEGADKNGNHWNNMVSDPSGSDYIIPVGRTVNLVNSANENTGYKAEMVTVMYTNGSSAAGGMTDPTDANLGDLAIATATEDYVWIAVDGKRQMRFKGLDKNSVYKFYIFGSRNINEDRHSVYTLNGLNDWTTVFQTSGVDIGGQGVQGNVRNVAVSDYMYPDADGNILFTLERYNSTGYGHFNLIKIEEYEGAERPAEPLSFSKLFVSGTASEGGKDVEMVQLAPLGVSNGVYETYLRLQPGTWHLRGITTSGAEVSLGQDESGTSVIVDGKAYTADEERVVRVRYESKTGKLDVTPVVMYVKGNICPSNTKLDYAGDGVWRSEVDLNYGTVFLFSDKYFYFAINNNDQLAIRRQSGSRTKVAMPSEGYGADNIRLNRGTYTVTLDMRNYDFDLDAPIDEYKISMFGSSVANGTGAASNQGYAYLYGQQLQTRYRRGVSENPFTVSGISIGGNTTIDLQNRYDELIHDFGRYVIFGLSLGNEGIHGAANPQAIYSQWRDNMLGLIEKARQDGKIPVVMNNYTRGDFTASDYSYVKQLNVLIHQWDVPSFNTLGAIDDGNGRWATNYQNGDDVYHPNTSGHREFMYAMTPSFFDALKAGKPLPERDQSQSMTISNGDVIQFTAEPTLSPFTISLRVKGGKEGRLISFKSRNKELWVGVNKEGKVYYHTPNQADSLVVDRVLNDDTWTTVTLTHYAAQKRTLLYVERQSAELSESMTGTTFTIGDADSPVERQLSELFFWRSALSYEEVAAHAAGRMLKSSLEIYSPLADDAKQNIENRAQSLNTVTFIAGQLAGLKSLTADAEEAAGKGIYTLDGKLVGNISDLPKGIYVTADKRKIVKK